MALLKLTESHYILRTSVDEQVDLGRFPSKEHFLTKQFKERVTNCGESVRKIRSKIKLFSISKVDRLRIFKRRHNQLLKASLIMVSFVFIFCKSRLRPFDTSIHSCVSLK